MHPGHRNLRLYSMFALMLITFFIGSGCHGFPHHKESIEIDSPHELGMSLHPEYVLGPPDIVLIDALRLTPKPPYRVDSLDVLHIHVAGMLVEPITGLYPVDPEGSVKLGATYGAVRVEGVTLEEAKKEIEKPPKKSSRIPLSR